MKLPNKIMIGEAEYRVAVTALMDEDYAGECHSEPKVLLISADQRKTEAWDTFFHEWQHGFEEEFKCELGHKVINKLEKAMTQLFMQLCAKKR